MNKKILILILLIYSAGLVFVLPYLYSSSSAYAIKSQRDVWLSTQLQPKMLFPRTSKGGNLLPNFQSIIKRMYRGSEIQFNEYYFRTEYLLKAGVSVSLKQVEESCSWDQMSKYRNRATVSLWYTRLIFSPENDPIKSLNSSFTEPSQDYPAVMLFIPRTLDTDFVNVLRCQQYLVFVPKNRVHVSEGT